MKFLVAVVTCALNAIPALAQPYIRTAMDHHEAPEIAVHPSGPVGPMPMSDIRFESEYRFPVSLILQGVTMQRNGHQQVSAVKYFINGQRAWLATTTDGATAHKKGSGALAVYDFDNNTMLLLTPARKTGLAMDLTQQCTKTAAAVKAGEEHWKCRRTGQRRIILTLHCDECICIDDVRKLRSDLWVTRDLHTDLAPVGIRTTFASQLRAAQRSGGVLVEGSFYEAGVLRSTVKMRDLNRSANLTVSLADYHMR